jgi:ribonuclease BN (tRNA processing enzyme)
MDRRAFVARLAALAALAAAGGLGRRASAAAMPTRLILLGTGGGPRPRKASSGSSQVIVANGTPYVIDCGDGVARQLVFAGVPLDALRHVLITHHHSDHNADYGNLLWLAWSAGLRHRVDTWGPPPLEKMTRLFLEMNATDIDARIANEGRVPLAPLLHVHELTGAGLVMQDENVRVTATLVHHPPMVPAFAYRFDAEDRSIVISGDTARSDNVVALARNADVLVHSALYVPPLSRKASSPIRRRSKTRDV